MEESQPKSSRTASELINPNREVYQHENLKHSCQKSTCDSQPVYPAHDKQEQGSSKTNETNEAHDLGVDFLVEPANVYSHDDDSQVDDAPKHAELILADLIVVHDLVGAGGKDSMIQVDENVGETYQPEDPLRH